MLKENSCEIFAGRQRGNTNIRELNVLNIHVEILLQVESTERGDIYVQAKPSTDNMWEWFKHCDVRKTLFIGSKLAPSFMAFHHCDSATLHDSWFVWNDQSFIVNSFRTGLDTSFITR